MKAITCYEDDFGNIHRTEQAAVLADARIKFEQAVEACSVHREFDGDEFLALLAKDEGLADAMSTIIADIQAKSRVSTKPPTTA